MESGNKLISNKPSSANKQSFLQLHVFDRGAYQLHAKDLPAIVAHYAKDNIKIFINGCTQFGQACITDKQKILQKRIDLFQNPAIQYALFFQENFLERGTITNSKFAISNIYPGLFRIEYDAIAQVLYKYKFIDKKTNKIKENLSYDDLIKLNNKIINLGLPDLKQAFAKFCKELQNDFDDCCLTEEEAIQEIKFIQKNNLEKNQSVGYIFTGGHKIKPAHFEVAIITNDKIIKPISWLHQLKALRPEMLPEMYYTIEGLLGKGDRVHPQAGGDECGTLGFMYLKNLLQDDASQLKALKGLTLTFDYYDQQGNIKHFFFPSPQVLRYSQSGFYNAIMLNMVQNDKRVEIRHDQKAFEVNSIKEILEESIVVANRTGNFSMAEKNQELLDQLPDFRKRWLEEFEKIHQKRETMQSNGGNFYLAYSTQRMQKIAQGKHQPKLKTKTKLQKQEGEIEIITISPTQEIIQKLGKNEKNPKKNYDN